MTALTYITHSPWLVRRSEGTPGDERIIIFPYAGSGPSSFYQWARQIPDDVEVFIIHLPGRERRFAEPPCGRLGDIVQAVARDLISLSPAKTLFFGYSLGTLIAYEVAKTLAARRLAIPNMLAVAAGSSPDNVERRPPVYDLPQGAFWREVMSYGGTSAEMAQDPELRAYAEPMLRADFKLIDEYRFAPHNGFDFPVLAVAGTNDHVCPPQYVRAWSDFTTGPFLYHEFDDAHFFIQQHGTALYKLIRELSEQQVDLREGG
jgi:medium-chain acyl-[acyl-carrier-protein] hydrolase